VSSAARNEPPVALRRLLPEAGELTADELVSELRPWELATGRRPHVAVNMVHTSDGRATVDGRTAPISSVADRQLFHALRTRVDAVMVGAGTLRIERYGRLVRDAARREQRRQAGLQPEPLAIVVSGSLDLPADLPLLRDPDSRVVIVTASVESIEGVKADVRYLRHPAGGVDLPAALERLRDENGVRSILCEGGPHLNASLLASGLIDELFLTTFPRIAGGAGALSIMNEALLSAPVAMALLSLCEHDGELFARYGLDTSNAASAP
jgi:riboflavin-specific deaminase-like protein